MAGLDASKLPELRPSASVLGPLTAEAAAELGDRRRDAGRHRDAGHDVRRRRVRGRRRARGALLPRHLLVAVLPRRATRRPIRSTRSPRCPSALPGRYLVSCEQQTGGRLAGDGARPLARRDARGARPATTALADLAAQAPPGSGGVLFLPWLNGERTPVDDHLARGGWLNLTPRHDARAARPRGARGRRAQRALDAGPGRALLQAAARPDRVHRRRRALAAVGADPRRRAGPRDPRERRPDPRERARRRVPRRDRARRAARRGRPGARGHGARRSRPDPAAASSTTVSTGSSSRSTRRPKPIYRRLNSQERDMTDQPSSRPARRDLRPRSSPTAGAFASQRAAARRGAPARGDPRRAAR